MSNMEFNVGVRYDETSQRQYVAQTLADIRAINAEAAKTPKGSPQRQALQGQAQETQIAFEARQRQTALLPKTPAEAAGYEASIRQVRAQLGKLERVYGIEVLKAEDLTEAIQEYAKVLKTAAKAETAASEKRIKDRNAAVGTKATEEGADPTLAKRGLPVVPGERPGKRTARIEAQDKLDEATANASEEILSIRREAARIQAETNAELKRVRDATRRELAVTEEGIGASALGKVDKIRAAGATDAHIAGRPQDVGTIQGARRQQDDLRSRVNADLDLVRANTEGARQANRRGPDTELNARLAAEKRVNDAINSIASNLEGQAKEHAKANKTAEKIAADTSLYQRELAKANEEAARITRRAGPDNQLRGNIAGGRADEAKINAAVNSIGGRLEEQANIHAKQNKEYDKAYAEGQKYQTRLRAEEAKDIAGREKLNFAHDKALKEAELRDAPFGRFQAIQQRVARRPGVEDRPGASFPTLPQAVGSGLITTARFAASGAILGAALGVKTLITEGAELERIFGQIEQEFKNTDKAGEFPRFKKGILDISRESGVAAKDVAAIGQQMQGAFNDTGKAVQATLDAVKVAKVTDLPTADIAPTLVASSKAFGVSIKEVGDEVLDLRERFRVLPAVAIEGLGAIGTTAHQAGLSLKETAAILGATQESSSRAGTTAAEALGRFLPGVGAKAGDILKTYQENDKLKGELPDIGKNLREGKTGQVLIQLTRDWPKLTKVEQENVAAAIGGAKGAQVINAFMADRVKLLAKLDSATGAAGKTDTAYAALQKTLAQRIAEVKAQLAALGLALVQSGLGSALKDLVTIAGGVLAIFIKIAEVFGTVNRVTGGLLIRVGELFLALKAYQFLRNAGGPGEAAGGIIKRTTARVLGRGAAGEVVGDVAGGAAGAAAGGAAKSAAGTIAGAAGGAAVGTAAKSLAFRAGATLAAEATVGSVAIPVVVTALAINAVRERVIAQLAPSVKEFRAKLKAATDQQLEGAVQAHQSVLESIGNFIGIDTAKSLTDKEVGKRRFNAADPTAVGGAKSLSEETAAAKAAGLLQNSNDQKGIGREIPFYRLLHHNQSPTRIVSEAEKGDQGSITELENQLNAIKRDPKKRAALEKELQTQRDRLAADQQKTDTAADITNESVVATAQEAKSLYESGQITLAEYVKNLADDAEKAKLLRDNAPQGSKLKDQAEKDLVRIGQAQASTKSTVNRKILDYNEQQGEEAGTSNAKTKVAALTAYLKNPENTDKAEKDRANKDLRSALKLELDEYANEADDAIERARRLREGIPIPDESRAATLTQEILSVDQVVQDFATKAAGTVQGGVDLISKSADLAVKAGISFAKAMKIIIGEKLKVLDKQILDLALAGGPVDEKALKALTDIRNPLTDAFNAPIPETTVAPPSARFRAPASEQASADKAARAEGKAKADKEHTLAEEAAKAKRNLDRALNEGDPVAIAKSNIQDAQELLAIAKTNAERLNAQAQIVTAQKALIKAQGDVADAYLNLDKAQAIAAGDTIAGAQLEVLAAQRHIDNARERGNKMDEIAAQTEKVNADANLISTTISTRSAKVDTALGLERISTQGAIAELQLLQKIPGETQDQVDQLQLKINALRKSASANLAFNIPSDIKLPTLYEVNRASQSVDRGIGYNDQRQININVTANNQSDLNSMAQTFASQFSGGSVFGAGSKRY